MCPPTAQPHPPLPSPLRFASLTVFPATASRLPAVSAENVTAAGIGTLPTRETRTGGEWFREHFDEAAAQVVEFLHSDGIELRGRDVADIGAGDGIIDLGVFVKAQPASLVGFDIVPTDPARLLEIARREAGLDELPEALQFRTSQPTAIPAPDDSFDLAFSWSTFEHVTEPTALLRDIHRVLRPDGVFMLQIWPLYHSQHGSHLWHWFPDGFAQLLRSPEEIEADVRRRPGPDPWWAERLLDEWRSCNRITLDGLQASLLAAGFRVSKVSLLTEPVHLPPQLERFPLSALAVAGVKLLAFLR